MTHGDPWVKGSGTMRRTGLIGLWMAILAGPALADLREDGRVCADPRNRQAQIAACTRLIGSSEIGPGNQAIAHNNRANAYIRLGLRGKAIADYGAAIRLNPKYANAYLNLGRTYQDMGDTQLYLLHCNKAIDAAPRYAPAYRCRAWAYFKMGQPARGLTGADKAIKLNPKCADCWDTRAHINEALGRKKAAAADFRIALRLDATLTSSRAGLRRLGAGP